MNPQTKIGILTFHRCINYGSYWQARSLVEGIRARGHEAVLLEHSSPRVNRAEWRCALQPVLPTPVPKSDRRLYALKMRKFFDSFAALPGSACFDLENPAQMEQYDLVIVGSDEVWNLRHPWYGGYPIFYGGGIQSTSLASYAASFGNYKASEGLAQSWIERLQAFRWISVRDENSRRIITHAIGEEPELVLDPCLQFPPKSNESPQPRYRSYVALYGHNFSASFSQAVRRWAKAQGFVIVSIGYRNDWADEQWITAGPEEFADFISQAEAVATNFFHGCVFSLLNAKPFICEVSEYRSNKIRDLMALLGGEAHLLVENTNDARCDAILNQPLAPSIFERISLLRQKSSSYLDKVLQ